MEQGSTSVPTVDELQVQVNEALLPLQASLPSLERFTVASITDINLTVKDFCSALRGLQSYASQGILHRVIASAFIAGAFSNILGMSTRDLYSFSQWIKTPTGKEHIANITTARNLEKRALHEQSPWVSIFTNMQAEHAAAVKKTKHRYKRKRDELRRQLEEIDYAEAKYPVKLESLCPVFFKFVPIERQAMEEGSWNAYVNYCVHKNLPDKPKNDHYIAQAITEFGPSVREAHAVAFCQLPEVQQCLEEFAKKKIASGSASKERETFRSLLAVATGRQNTITTPAAKEGTLAATG